MALFGKKKKEESCCCGGDCNALEDSVRKALEQLGIDTEIDHVTDYMQIASFI